VIEIHSREIMSMDDKSTRRHPVRMLVGAALSLAVLIALVTWVYVSNARGLASPASNAIMVVAPYWYNGTWVFDDGAAGLRREPFVAGVPAMIDVLVKDIPSAREGFRLLFFANPFPGDQKRLTWLRGDMGGNDYRLDDPPMEGWICPATFRYYKSAPRNLYVKAESRSR
jgi:Family of unknown function (DUF6717)